MYPSTLLLPILFALTIAQNSCTGDKSTIGHCTITSFVDKTSSSPDPPPVSECMRTCSSVLTDAGDWLVDFRGQPEGYIDHMLLFPCAFSVGRGAGEPLDYQFDMHNQDIVDILDEVNQRFGPLHGDRVAAEGTMVCDGHQATWYVD